MHSRNLRLWLPIQQDIMINRWIDSLICLFIKKCLLSVESVQYMLGAKCNLNRLLYFSSFFVFLFFTHAVWLIIKIGMWGHPKIFSFAQLMCIKYGRNFHLRISYKIETRTQILWFHISWSWLIVSILPFNRVLTLSVLETGGGG